MGICGRWYCSQTAEHTCVVAEFCLSCRQPREQVQPTDFLEVDSHVQLVVCLMPRPLCADLYLEQRWCAADH